MPSLVILGAGGHAKVVADLVRLAGWTIEGFVDERHPERAGEELCGTWILSGDAMQALRTGGALALGIGDCAARLDAAKRWRGAGFSLPVLIHPRSIVASSATLGEGCQVIAGAVINPDAVLGMAVIVNTAATVDHDCRLADGVHLAPGVHLAGDVSIGEATLVGIGSVVRPGVRIGSRCVIGAGSVVVHDVPDGATVFGVPARVQ